MSPRRKFLAVAAAALVPALSWGQAATLPLVDPGRVQVYKDWVVGCDNALSCTALALFPEAGKVEGGSELEVTRGPQPQDAPSLRFILEDKPKSGPISVMLDGKRVANGTVRGSDVIISGAAAFAVARALAQGKELSLEQGDGVLAQPSLAGASAALRYLDAQQNRAGGVTAIVARGAKPASAIQPAPALPTLQPARITQADADIAPLTEAELTRAVKLGGCEADFDLKDEGMASMVGLHSLDAARTLLLVPCGAGAYNFSSAVLIASGKPGSRQFVPATFDDKDAGSPSAARILVNVSWGAGDARLDSYSRGRGIGDCGESKDYVWDGSRFRLFSADSMPECRGSQQTITTWRATVAPR